MKKYININYYAKARLIYRRLNILDKDLLYSKFINERKFNDNTSDIMG